MLFRRSHFLICSQTCAVQETSNTTEGRVMLAVLSNGHFAYRQFRIQKFYTRPTESISGFMVLVTNRLFA